MRRVGIGLGVVLALVALWWFTRSPGSEPVAAGGSDAGKQAANGAAQPGLTRPQTAPASAASASQAPAKPSATRRDRAARDEMRKRIYAAFGQEPPEAGKPRRPGAPPPSAVTDAAPGLEPAYIQSRIREDFFPLAKECYEAALEKQPELAGKLVLSFEIVGDESVGGVVESAEPDDATTLEDEEFLYCVKESMLSMTFEPPKGGGKVTVNYPFLFSPHDLPDSGFPDAGDLPEGDGLQDSGESPEAS